MAVLQKAKVARMAVRKAVARVVVPVLKVAAMAVAKDATAAVAAVAGVANARAAPSASVLTLKASQWLLKRECRRWHPRVVRRNPHARNSVQTAAPALNAVSVATAPVVVENATKAVNAMSRVPTAAVQTMHPQQKVAYQTAATKGSRVRGAMAVADAVDAVRARTTAPAWRLAKVSSRKWALPMPTPHRATCHGSNSPPWTQTPSLQHQGLRTASPVKSGHVTVTAVSAAHAANAKSVQTCAFLCKRQPSCRQTQWKRPLQKCHLRPWQHPLQR